MKIFLKIALLILVCGVAEAMPTIDADTTGITLGEVTVSKRASGLKKLKGSVTNTEIISAQELTRAACCNLGESFTTNPSVDVNYNDAATGARQIKLLGLSGTYVQMLTENIPNLRGAALPYGLSYIAGPWIQSISVSKGTSSVKNGYESISGQINIELKKPQADREVAVNGYIDSDIKAELNANANFHLTKKLSTAILLHGENSFEGHDGNNDGFLDMPKIKQFSAMNRWAYMSRNYVFQAGVKYMHEQRESGQHEKHGVNDESHRSGLYKIDMRTNRVEAFTKNAYIFDHANDGNIALIVSGTYHNLNSLFGHDVINNSPAQFYNVKQRTLYASLMFERKWNGMHNLSTGLSFNHDDFTNDLQRVINGTVTTRIENLRTSENVAGAYAQYTLSLGHDLLAMAGVRYDHSNLAGSMFTPRFHLRYNPKTWLSVHGSVGKGYRNPNVLAENMYILASSRPIIIEENLRHEEAVNYGIGASSTIYFGNRTLNLNSEYYYTDFKHQIAINLDTNPGEAMICNVAGKSYSHALQVDATIDIIENMHFMAAYRMTKVMTDFGSGLLEKPLQSRNKGLFSLGYAPMMGKWQFDVTYSINGGGRMPTPMKDENGNKLWNDRYHAFGLLSAQATRNFRYWSVYVGGENLTAYRQKNAIIDAMNPFGKYFDATMVYGPMHGAIVYVGFRYNFKKY